MSKKIRVAILFGGKSAEHEVSLQSAKNVVDAIDRERYEVVLIGIDKQGCWHLCDAEDFLLHADDPSRIALKASGEPVALVTGEGGQPALVTLNEHRDLGPVDVVFPVLHGTFGEDGTIQGLLKLADVPFVGAGVLGSAVGMDKDVMKRLLRDAGLPIPKFFVVTRAQADALSFEHAVEQVGRPLFVKPANLGSSVGIHKVASRAEFDAAVKDAFRYDTKIIVEEAIVGREIECSVLGNETPQASLPGEIIPTHEFYSYEAKYLDEAGARLEIPAKLPDETVRRVQELAVRTFQVLCCEGLARVDFFLQEDGAILVNEINTIPGFTRISMYPKLWEVSGLAYPELIHRLLQLAIERFEREKALETSVRLS